MDTPFFRRTAFTLILTIFLAPQTFAGAWIKSLTVAQKKAKESKQLIFVDLFANWCGWCHRMEQEVFPSQVFQNATTDLVLLRLDTEDRGEGSKIAQQFNVTSLPTFLLLTDDMLIAGVIRGYQPPNDFVRSLSEVEGKYEEFQKRVKQEPGYAKDYQKRLELAREFTQRGGHVQGETRLKKLLGEKGLPSPIRDAAYYELAASQFLQGKYSDALASVNALSKLQNKGEAYELSRLLLGQIYMQQGNLAAAVSELRNFTSSFPNSPHARTAEILLPVIEARLKK